MTPIYGCSANGALPQPDEACRGRLGLGAPVGRVMTLVDDVDRVYEPPIRGWWACWPPVRSEPNDDGSAICR
jgi:hypothetical protein